MPNILDLQYGTKPIVSAALENSHVLITPTTFGFGGPFVISGLTVSNYDTATGYVILLLDSTTLPANGAVTPIYNFFIPVATATVPSVIAVTWISPAKFTNGIVVAGSTSLTTPFTLTVATNSKLTFSAEVAA